jgi:hypothetical protein
MNELLHPRLRESIIGVRELHNGSNLIYKSIYKSLRQIDYNSGAAVLTHKALDIGLEM